ncbi:hypothetical protein SAMN04488094_102416 [Tropicimonas isoalkanivorans]|uniref:Uncharacterized protein n=1 Tax=Tropicimonas isoalkanivorans TaxID=441112 RepID=A0A1I1G5B7_9RHOB|nr:hypothetical protein SAMN04488094_102416 [Tropicimonas isoalkanivorans]
MLRRWSAIYPKAPDAFMRRATSTCTLPPGGSGAARAGRPGQGRSEGTRPAKRGQFLIVGPCSRLGGCHALVVVSVSSRSPGRVHATGGSAMCRPARRVGRDRAGGPDHGRFASGASFSAASSIFEGRPCGVCYSASPPPPGGRIAASPAAHQFQVKAPYIARVGWGSTPSRKRARPFGFRSDVPVCGGRQRGAREGHASGRRSAISTGGDRSPPV